MSIWTHINASIRFDLTNFSDDLKPVLGKMYLPYEDSFDLEGYDGFIPCGSEGSLRYSIWESKNPDAAASCTVNIFGDLRDYNDEQEILLYFNRITELKLIRSGILEIDIEGHAVKIYKCVNCKWVLYEK